MRVDVQCIVVQLPTDLFHYLEASYLGFQPMSIGNFFLGRSLDFYADFIFA